MKKSITSQKYKFSLFITLCGVMVFLLTIMVNPLFVSAEGSSSLPYFVEEDLPFDFDTALEDCFNSYSSVGGVTYSDALDAYNYIVRRESPLDATDYITYTIYIFMDSNSYTVSLSNNDYDSFSDSDTVIINGLGYGSNNGKFISLHYTYKNWAGGFVPDGYGTNNDSSLSFKIVSSGQSDFRPKLIKQPFLTYDGDVVFTNQNDDPLDISGHSQPPVDDNGHYIDDGTGNRIPKPNKPTPSVYTPPTIQFPSIDTSSLENLIESLIDLVQYGISYLGGVINGSISNLLSNLDLWFDYLVSSFNFGINNIVGAIKDLAQTFYNNMVSLFEPFYDFFSGVTNFFNSLLQLGMVDGVFSFSTFITKLIVPDVSDVVDLLTDHDAFGSHALFLASYHKIQFLINTFKSLQPIKVFTVPSTTWHGYTIGGFTIDFSWYDDFKIYMDLILSGFLVIGYLYWLFTSLNSLFRGTGSMVYDSLYEPQTKGGEHH